MWYLNRTQRICLRSQNVIVFDLNLKCSGVAETLFLFLIILFIWYIASSNKCYSLISIRWASRNTCPHNIISEINILCCHSESASVQSFGSLPEFDMALKRFPFLCRSQHTQDHDDSSSANDSSLLYYNAVVVLDLDGVNTSNMSLKLQDTAHVSASNDLNFITYVKIKWNINKSKAKTWMTWVTMLLVASFK